MAKRDRSIEVEVRLAPTIERLKGCRELLACVVQGLEYKIARAKNPTRGDVAAAERLVDSGTMHRALEDLELVRQSIVFAVDNLRVAQAGQR